MEAETAPSGAVSVLSLFRYRAGECFIMNGHTGREPQSG